MAGGLVGLLAIVVGIGCLICFIMVLVKLFQEEGALKGVLGLICGLYTYVWGWMNASRLGINTIMMIWTVLAIVSLILRFALGGLEVAR